MNTMSVPGAGSTDLTLKEVTIVHENGTKEQVYVPLDTVNKKGNWKDGLSTAYIIVGTLALTMTAIVTYLQLRKMKSHG